MQAAKLVAFVGTRAPAQARRFYGEVLGLRLIEETPFAIVFDAPPTVLRITFAPEFVPAPFTVLGWEVPDLNSAVAELVSRSVTFERYPQMVQDELAIWTSPSGDRVAWFQDPDGNVLSLTQLRPKNSKPRV